MRINKIRVGLEEYTFSSGVNYLVPGSGIGVYIRCILSEWYKGISAVSSLDRQNRVLLEGVCSSVEVSSEVSYNGEDYVYRMRYIGGKYKSECGLGRVSSELEKVVYSGMDEDLILPLLVYYPKYRSSSRVGKRVMKFERDKVRTEGYRGGLGYKDSMTGTLKYLSQLYFESVGDEFSRHRVEILSGVLGELVGDGVVYFDYLGNTYMYAGGGVSGKLVDIDVDLYDRVMLVVDMCVRLMKLNPHIVGFNGVSGIVVIEGRGGEGGMEWVSGLSGWFEGIEFIVL